MSKPVNDLPSTDMVLIMTSFAKLEEAQTLAKECLAMNMIACANIIPNAISLYQWQNELIEDQECLVIMKTLTHQTKSVKDYLIAHHTYDIPEFITLPVSETTDAYLSWIQKEIS